MYTISEKALKTQISKSGFKDINDFCRKSGIHRNILYEYLNGKSPIHPQAEKIANSLNCDPIRIFAKREFSSSRNLPEGITEIINRVVKSNSKLCLFLLGSRAEGTGKKHSDWDIGLTHATGTLSSKAFLLLKHNISEICIDSKHAVDLIWLDNAPDWFLKEIKSPVYLGGSKLAASRFIERLESCYER